MKSIVTKLSTILALTVFMSSLVAQVEFSEVRTSSSNFVSLHKLNCSIRLGSNVDEQRRRVTTIDGLDINSRLFPSALFEHQRAFANGCDRLALDNLVDDSFTRYNHAPATITLIQKTAKSPRIYRGQCVRNIQEQVEIDFQQGTVLITPSIGKVIPATGC